MTKMTKTTKKSFQGLGIVIIVLLAINLIFNTINFFNKWVGANSTLAIEQLKAGGAENFDIMTQIFKSPKYQEQQKKNLLQTLESFKWEAEAQWDTQKVAVDTTNNADMVKKIKNIMDDAHILWNKDARFTILEYSEFFCPYCKRQHDQGTIETVMKNFDGNVNTVHRHFIVHPGAERYSEASECIADIEGVDAYYKFIDKAFGLSSAINDASLDTIIKDMWRNSKKIHACIDDGTFANKIDAETQEGRSLFGIKGTPGNVIIDHKTGKFVLIPGAYPAEKFIEEINKLMQ